MIDLDAIEARWQASRQPWADHVTSWYSAQDVPALLEEVHRLREERDAYVASSRRELNQALVELDMARRDRTSAERQRDELQANVSGWRVRVAEIERIWSRVPLEHRVAAAADYAHGLVADLSLASDRGETTGKEPSGG